MARARGSATARDFVRREEAEPGWHARDLPFYVPGTNPMVGISSFEKKCCAMS